MGIYVPNFTRLKLGGATPSVLTEDMLETAQDATSNDDYIPGYEGSGVRIGRVSISTSPSGTVAKDTQVTYTASNSGNVSNKSYTWTTDADPSEYTVTGASTVAAKYTWLKGGTYKVTCKVESTDAGVKDNPRTQEVSTTVTVNIGAITLAGPDSASIGATSEYTATIDGSSESVSYQFACPDETFTVDGNKGTVIWSTAATKDVVVTVTDSDASDGPSKTQSKTVTVSEAPTIGDLTVTGNANAKQDSTENYEVANTGDATIDAYLWSCNDSSATLSNQTTDTVTVVWGGSLGNKTLTVKLTDDDGNEKETTYAVAVTEESIGVVTVTGSANPQEDTATTYTIAYDGDIAASRIDDYQLTVTPSEGVTLDPTGGSATVDVTFTNAGDYTISATVVSDGGQSVATTEANRLSVTVSATPIALTLSSEDLVDGTWANTVAALSPRLTWTLTGGAAFTGYSIYCIDETISTDEDPYIHWNIRRTEDGGGGLINTTDTTVSLPTPDNAQINNLPGEPNPGTTSGGFANANGFETFLPDQGDTHTYTLTVAAMNGATVVAQASISGEFTTPEQGGGDTGTAIQQVTVTQGGSGYTDGNYNNVALNGGSGSGASASVVVISGEVTFVNVTNGGSTYAVSDTLSIDDADIGGGGGSGAVLTVDSIG